jgi:hypothetical protein
MGRVQQYHIHICIVDIWVQNSIHTRTYEYESLSIPIPDEYPYPLDT